MNEALPPPAPRERTDTTLLVACATIVILAALSAGGYVLWQELQRMASAKPAAPAEVTEALTDLQQGLERQRTENATQLQTLQNEISALKQQQAAQPTPDIDATLAPVQEKLDAIAAQLQEAPPVIAAPRPVEVPAAAPEIPMPLATPSSALRDYLALRRAVESGEPYAAELAVLIPQLPDTQQDAIATLQAYAENGLGESDAMPTTELAPWMESVNDRLHGLVAIRPALPKVDDDTHADVTDALDAIETSLLGAP